jgi:NhaC family Na+:H+ antiporter
MIGGTIPLMIYYGLNLINPSMIYVTALLVTAVVSVCTGTSWGSAGTVGVAFMGGPSEWRLIWQQLLALLWRELLRDKLSPLSGDTNLAAMAAQIDLYEHIAHLLYTTLPSLILSAVVMTLYGMNGDLGGSTVPDKVQLITEGLKEFTILICCYCYPLLLSCTARLPRNQPFQLC